MTKLTIVRQESDLRNLLKEIRSTSVYNDVDLNHRQVSELI